MKYRKKPVVIEAFRLGIDNIPDWFMNEVTSNNVILRRRDTHDPETLMAEIGTLEGVMTAKYGDYVIQGVIGELYPCRADIFEETYELVEEKQVMNE